MASSHSKNYALQVSFWQDFCSALRHKKGKLKEDRVLEDSALQTKWSDYCSIRFKHFALELLPILRKNCKPKKSKDSAKTPTGKNKASKSPRSALAQKFLYKRHKVGNLPNLTDVAGLVDYDFKNYNEISTFIENLSMIEKKYYTVWNGVASLFMSFSKDDPNFDGHWHKKIKQQSYYQQAQAQAQAQVQSNTATGSSGYNVGGYGKRSSANPNVSAFEAAYAANNSVFRQSFSKRFNSISSRRSSSSIFNSSGLTTPRSAFFEHSSQQPPPNATGSSSSQPSMLTPNDLRIELKRFLIARLQKTGLFETRSDMITAVFDENNSPQCFDELIDYCIQDISDPSVYCRYKNDGFEYFIINRLTFAVFIGLFNNELNKRTTINQFEDLHTFFNFMWDFSVYNMCFARSNNGGDRTGITFDESFYISQFLFWKENCCFGLRREEAKILEIKQRSLSRSQSGLREMSFSQGPDDMARELSSSSAHGHVISRSKKKSKKKTLARGTSEDDFDVNEKEKISLIINCSYFPQGTLLHSATYSDMLHYCRLLCENNSDIHKHNQSNGQTPYIVSKLQIRSYFDSLMIPKFTTTKAQESEVNYFALKNQKAFSNYFMLYLGMCYLSCVT